ncbi:energy-coupling factor transporter ATPase [Salibacterium aidingense]|uniref:energy-coupling factor transporter ATPase n=1 Tax=Salibacterium aidingense TaxID=384933 RepID=UPI003BE9EB8F
MNVTIQQLSHVFMPNTPFETKALQEVTLAFPEGSFSAVIGRTGSGKSTLVQHMNGLLKPSAGKLEIGGQVIHPKTKRKTLNTLRRKVGMVFQYPEHQLFEETVEKDILFGPKNIGLSMEKMKKKLPQLLEQVGLDESFLPRSPFDLSGGQMRRTAIAGVLAMEPELLILDEPTAGLDPQGQEDMITLFQEWHHVHGTTVILITHQMEEAARLAEHVIVMEEGQVSMEGRPQEIYERESELKALDLDIPERVRVLKQIEEETGCSFSSYSLSPEEAVKEIRQFRTLQRTRRKVDV